MTGRHCVEQSSVCIHNGWRSLHFELYDLGLVCRELAEVKDHDLHLTVQIGEDKKLVCVWGGALCVCLPDTSVHHSVLIPCVICSCWRHWRHLKRTAGWRRRLLAAGAATD